MDVLQRGIITLIKSALTQQKDDIPELDYSEVYAVGARHHITSLLFYGVVVCGIQLCEELKTRYFMETCISISVDQKQLCELQNITESFRKNCIDYMLLKGSVLKNLYPKTDMRVMGDIDILIRLEQYEFIRQIMRDLGYEEIAESDNELVWYRPPLIRVELHKALFPTTHNDYFTYFEHVWELVNKNQVNNVSYSFNNEDHLIYLFTHFADHYRNGGIGIKHMVDLYVFISKHSSLEVSYIKAELTKLHLYVFYENILRTLSSWFDNVPSNEMADFITSKIFISGAYGTNGARQISGTIKASKTEGSVFGFKLKKLFLMAFLPYFQMCELYSILRNYPILLPVMWILRWVNAIFCKRDNISKHKEFLKSITLTNFENYQQELKYVGLDLG